MREIEGEREREREMGAFNGRLVALQCSPNVHVIDIWPSLHATAESH